MNEQTSQMTAKVKTRMEASIQRSALLRDSLVACIVICVLITMPEEAPGSSPASIAGETYGPKVIDIDDNSPNEDEYLKEESKPSLQPAEKAEPFPVNQVKWGPGRRPVEPEDQSAGQLQVWDITGSKYRKVIRLKIGEYYDNGDSDFSSPVITLYIEAGTRGIIYVPVGSYEILGMSGGQWNGSNFGDETTAVTFGRFEVTSQGQTILAIGAIDQKMEPISVGRF